MLTALRNGNSLLRGKDRFDNTDGAKMTSSSLKYI